MPRIPAKTKHPMITDEEKVRIIDQKAKGTSYKTLAAMFNKRVLHDII
jgi:hypothetical protein